MITWILAAILLLVTSIFLYFKICFTYWKNRNLIFFKPSIPFGNLHNPFSKESEHSVVRIKQYYDYFKSKGEKHAGLFIYQTPVYMPIDLDIIKSICMSDFNYFAWRGTYTNEKDQPMSKNLFHMGGAEWKHLRATLTPTFTTQNLKLLIQTILDCCKPLEDYVASLALKNHHIDTKDVVGKFTIDVIGSCSFGINCNSFTNPDSLFAYYSAKIFSTTLRKALIMPFTFAFPNLCRRLHVVTFPKDSEEFFTNVVKDTVEYRINNNITRRDFLQILISMMSSKDDGAKISLQDVISQSVMFFNGGYEPVANTMSFILFELSQNVIIQSKLREEINTVLKKYDGNYTYEAINEMKYMQQVIDETLRIYPTFPLIGRTCIKTYKVPGTDVIIDKGTKVFIPVYCIHRDSEYYPNPDQFDPDRFSDENKTLITPYSFMGFGKGQMTCIALRFVYLEIKIGIAALLKRFIFTLNLNTQLPIQFTKNFSLQVKGGILLNCKEIKS